MQVHREVDRKDRDEYGEKDKNRKKELQKRIMHSICYGNSGFTWHMFADKRLYKLFRALRADFCVEHDVHYIQLHFGTVDVEESTAVALGESVGAGFLEDGGVEGEKAQQVGER